MLKHTAEIVERASPFRGHCASFNCHIDGRTDGGFDKQEGAEGRAPLVINIHLLAEAPETLDDNIHKECDLAADLT